MLCKKVPHLRVEPGGEAGVDGMPTAGPHFKLSACEFCDPARPSGRADKVILSVHNQHGTPNCPVGVLGDIAPFSLLCHGEHIAVTIASPLEGIFKLLSRMRFVRNLANEELREIKIVFSPILRHVFCPTDWFTIWSRLFSGRSLKSRDDWCRCSNNDQSFNSIRVGCGEGAGGLS